MNSLTHLPNLLSYSRALVAVLIVLFGSSFSDGLVLSFICFAVLSDVFDGVLARVLDCQTDFGAKLDPICDGIFVMGVLYFILMREGISVFYFWALLVRYVVISWYHYELLSKGQKQLSSLWTGKWSSGLMMACFVYYFAQMSGVSLPFFDMVFPYFIGVTGVMLLVSWVFYFQRYLILSRLLSSTEYC